MAPGKPAQSFVPVEGVRNGIIILKEGGLRMVLMASSVNFALKSDVEQNAILGAFQTFLNTLDFSVQILVNSRELDIRPYLALLEHKQATQTSELMRLQLREYSRFIEQFVDQTSIMRKQFYVIVPFRATTPLPTPSGLPFLKGKSSGEEDTRFSTQAAQLEQRAAVVAQGLAAAGVRTTRLDTEAVLELLYRSFNPGVFETPIQQ